MSTSQVPVSFFCFCKITVKSSLFVNGEHIVVMFFFVYTEENVSF